MTIPALKPKLSRETIVLGIIAFFVMVGFGVVIPVLPVFIRSFQVGYTEIGAVIAAFALMRLIANPFVGKLVDVGGERMILTIGIAVVALSSAMVGVAQSYLEVLLYRGAGGVGSTMFSVSAMTLLLRTTDSSMRGRAVGFYQGGFLIGGMAGPALGGVLALISLRAPFFFYAATLIVAGVIGLIFLRSRVPKQNIDSGAVFPAKPDLASADKVRPLREVLNDRRFRAACLANLASGWASVGVRSALVPVLVVEVLHKGELWTGIAFAIAAVAQTLALGPAGNFVDKVGRKPAIAGACGVGAVVIMAIPFAGDIWLLTALLATYGVAAAFLGTAPAASVGDAAGGRSGQPVAIFSAFSDLGAIVGPLAAGALLDALSYEAAFGSAAVLLLAVCGYTLFRMPPLRQRKVL